MTKIVECVANFSEGKNKKTIDDIVGVVREASCIKFLDFSSDIDHNRSVITFSGSPENVERVAFSLVKTASKLIDMSKHKGEHPRIGSVDVLPFIPIKNITMEECVAIAKRVGEKIGSELGIPVYLYEDASSNEERKNLANIRRGQYEGFFEKIKYPDWKPDFGPSNVNIKNGCIAVGARKPLIAFNINLGTGDIEIAKKIARKIRQSNGGLVHIKAIAIKLQERKAVQVSINITNHEITPVFEVFETVKSECVKYGVGIIGSELIGLIPISAVLNTVSYYLQLENCINDRVLEYEIFKSIP